MKDFITWLENLDSDEGEQANSYFSIGHGDDYDLDSAMSHRKASPPPYVVWTYYGGKVLAANSGTHGTNWGHNVTDLEYKGRYEPRTGRLSIVKPHRWEHLPIPSQVMSALNQKFHISQVFEF